jgi:DNA-binding beta-propeller fold protein YncE
MLKKTTLLFTALFLTALALSGCTGKSPELPRILWPPPPDQPRLEFIGTFYSEGDFPKTDSQRMLESVVGKENVDTFKTPFGIAADGKGKVYVSDIHLHNIRIFDFTQQTVEFLTKESIFTTPLGLAVDGSGNLYVADGGKQSVMVFSPEKVPLFSFGNSSLFENPAYLAINRNLGRLYVSDGKGHKIVVFDLKGNHLFSFSRQGRGEGEVYGPQGLAIDSQGRVFVADLLNSRVVVFDSEGKYLYAFGERGDQVWQFENPKDVAFDSEGNLYVIDRRKATIFTYTPDGKLLLATGSGAPSTHKLGFASPTSIFIDQGDRIYVADGLNKRFSVWQYLSAPYLEKHPITPEDREALKRFIEESKGKNTQ